MLAAWADASSSFSWGPKVSYRISTQAYSGPFDLLLQLVSRQKVDIGAISIAEVADQYLAEIERMSDMDLDVASDFVLVASTLLDIKAASLVPDEPLVVDVDEDEDVEKQVTDKLMIEKLRSVLPQLSEDEQLLIRRHYYDNIPETELAKIYGISQQAISKRMLKIKAKLKNLMEN